MGQPVSLAVMILTSLLTLPAQAAGTTDYAKVIASQPVYENTQIHTPQKLCHIETQKVVVKNGTDNRNNGARGTGAIVGGLLGHAISRHHHSSDLGQVVGTVVGAVIGSEVAGRGHAEAEKVVYREQEVCKIVDRIETQPVLIGYDVTYRYHGNTYSTFRKTKPGDRIRVAVHVEAIE